MSRATRIERPYIGLAVRRTLRHYGLIPLGETWIREYFRRHGRELPAGLPPARVCALAAKFCPRQETDAGAGPDRKPAGRQAPAARILEPAP